VVRIFHEMEYYLAIKKEWSTDTCYDRRILK
jgi:hypothetical protein